MFMTIDDICPPLVYLNTGEVLHNDRTTIGQISEASLRKVYGKPHEPAPPPYDTFSSC